MSTSSHPCLHDGECQSTTTDAGRSSFVCTCAGDWEGSICQYCKIGATCDAVEEEERTEGAEEEREEEEEKEKNEGRFKEEAEKEESGVEKGGKGPTSHPTAKMEKFSWKLDEERGILDAESGGKRNSRKSVTWSAVPHALLLVS